MTSTVSVRCTSKERSFELRLYYPTRTGINNIQELYVTQKLEFTQLTVVCSMYATSLPDKVAGFRTMLVHSYWSNKEGIFQWLNQLWWLSTSNT